VSFGQNLSSGTEKLFAGLPRDTRYAIRKSLKAGLSWTDDITLGEFYEIYAQNVHRLGTPVFSKSWFADLLTEFPTQCKIFGVRKGRTPIAAVVCFYFSDEVMPYYGGSVLQYSQYSPNNFMYWNLIAQSCADGLRYFDFGRSKRGTGACMFKSSWSMKITELPYRYQLIRTTRIPEMSPIDKKFKSLVSLWKRLPFPLTKVVGPQLIRWIPSA
jgi:FemAB-related protein (PEP-CTERM system-associated)